MRRKKKKDVRGENNKSVTGSIQQVLSHQSTTKNTKVSYYNIVVFIFFLFNSLIYLSLYTTYVCIYYQEGPHICFLSFHFTSCLLPSTLITNNNWTLRQQKKKKYCLYFIIIYEKEIDKKKNKNKKN